MNRRNTIRHRCLDCSGFKPGEVRNCTFLDCPLFPYRMGTGKQNPKQRDKAIRAYCRECVGNNRPEVYLCPSAGCPLYPFRLTTVKKDLIEPTTGNKTKKECHSRGNVNG